VKTELDPLQDLGAPVWVAGRQVLFSVLRPLWWQGVHIFCRNSARGQVFILKRNLQESRKSSPFTFFLSGISFIQGARQRLSVLPLPLGI